MSLYGSTGGQTPALRFRSGAENTTRPARVASLPSTGAMGDRRPAFFVVLAAAFVVASFLDGVRLLEIPIAETPANVLGVILSAAFVSTRVAMARLWSGPVKFFWVFILLSAGTELLRLAGDHTGYAMVSLRNYAQYAQAFLLYLIFYDLSRDRRAVSVVAATFLVAAITMSLIANFGLGGLVGSAGGRSGPGAERVGVLGMGLNLQGFVYAVAVCGIACRSLQAWPRLGAVGWTLVGGAASMVLALLQTGSRGGLVVLAVGIGAVLLLMFRGRRWTAYLLLVPVALYGMGSAAMNTEVIMSRMQKTVYEGDWGARDLLAREAMVMVAERSVSGWGSAYTEELGERVGKARIAAHNTYLQMAAAFGLLGFVPWMIGMGATLWRLWCHRRALWGAALLATMIALMTAMIPGNFAYNKFAWMFLAIAGAMPLGSALQADRRIKTPLPTPRNPGFLSRVRRPARPV